MKIRTDFVTNSSSSSFIVNLNLELSNKTTFAVSLSSPISGDVDDPEMPIDVSLTIENGVGDELFSAHNDDADALDVFLADLAEDSDDNRSDRELSYLKDLTYGVGALLFSYPHPVCLESFHTFSALDEVAETIARSFPLLEDRLDAISEHITDVRDIKSVTLSMEFWASGDFPLTPEFVLGYIFGIGAEDILEILNTDTDSDELAEALKDCSCLSKYTANSINNMIEFWEETDEFVVGLVSVEQTLLKDGSITLKIMYN